MLTERTLQARASLASETRRAKRRPDDPEAQVRAEEARRDFYALRLEEYIERVVREAPPLTSDQRDRLSMILRGERIAG